MDPRLLRFIYICEFFLCLLVVFIAWPQIGGQMHIDLIDWQYKLLAGAMFSFAAVRATMAGCAAEQPWNARLSGWFIVVLLSMLAMGVLTYNAHLNEPPDDQELHMEDSPEPRNL